MILLLLACVAGSPTSARAEFVAPTDIAPRGNETETTPHAESVASHEPSAGDGGVEGFGDWWDKHKYAVQSLVGCGLASAFLARTFIVGVVNPPGAVLGIVGAAVMVLVCL